QSHRRLAPADAQPRRLVADRDEPANAFLLAVRVENSREDKMEARDAPAGDPMLVAVDDKAIALAVGSGRELARGAAGFGLGDADRRLVPGEDEIRGEALLRLRAVFHDRADRTHVRLDDNAAADAASLCDLLDHENRVEIAEAAAAIGA